MAIGRLRCMRCGGDHRTDDCDDAYAQKITVGTPDNHIARKPKPVLQKLLEGDATIAKTLTIRGPVSDWRSPGYVWDEDLLKAAKAELMKRYRARRASKK